MSLPQTLSPEKLAEIVRKYVTDCLTWEENHQANTPMNPYEHEDRLAFIEEIIHHHQEVAAEGQHRQAYKERASSLLKEHGIDPNPEPTNFNQLCRMLAHADSRACQVALKWQQGEWTAKDISKVINDLGIESESAPPAALPDEGVGTPAGATAGAPAGAPAKAGAGTPALTLGALMKAFWEERSPAWKERTKTEYATCRARLLDFIGEDTPVHSLDYFRVKKCRDKLVDSGLSIARVNLYTGFLRAVLSFEMATTRVLNVNPCERLQLKDQRRKDELRAAFDLDDLKALFVNSPEYGQDRLANAERFWVPLLALYTGARMEELCQLYSDQVVEVDGYHCIQIEAKHEGQSVKTSEKRLVPLHPFLLELGFHRFAQGMKGHLWPNLRRINNRYGHYFGRFFKEYKDRCGIDPTPQLKTFHSFRHTVETKLQYEETDQRYLDQLMGHSNKAESARYGKKSMERIHDKGIMKLNWREEVGLDHLLKSRWAR